MNADVVHLDLIKTVGLGGDGELGQKAGGFFKLGLGNPVLIRDESEIRGVAGSGMGTGVGVSAGEEEGEIDGMEDKEYDPEEDQAHENEDEEHEDDAENEDGDQDSHPAMISGPFEIAIPVGSNASSSGGPMGLSSGVRVGAGPAVLGMDEARDVGSEVDKDGMLRVFGEVVNLGDEPHSGSRGSKEGKEQEAEGKENKTEDVRGRPRIIYVQHAVPMNASFASWYWALSRAVRIRNNRGYPTTIVLSVTPSFLHLGANLSLPVPTAPAEPAENPGLPPGLGELMKAMKRMREGPGAGQGQGKKEDEFWKGSEEEDKVGRRKRGKKRLGGFQLGDERALRRFLPAFADPDIPSHYPAEAKEGLMRLRGTPLVTPRIWRVLGTLPAKRDEAAERKERFEQRLELNRLLLKKAVGKHGLRFTDKEMGDELNSDEPRSDEVIREYQELRDSFALAVWPWTTLQHLATIGVGHALTQRAVKAGEGIGADFEIGWKDLAEASVAEAHAEDGLEKWKETHKAGSSVQSAVVHPHPRPGKGKSSSTAGKSAEKKLVDPVVEKLKKDKTLNNHEKRLLSCIVDHHAVKNTTFDDVAMEDKTKDAVRSTISLPLLYPEAFRSGILAQHASQGVLLYGECRRGSKILGTGWTDDSTSQGLLELERRISRELSPTRAGVA